MREVLDNADLAYRLEIEACGETFLVERSMDLVRRVEQAAGPIQPLVDRLSTSAITQRELSVLIDTLLHNVAIADGRPARRDIEAWVFERGTARVAKPLAYEVMTLILGNEILAEVIARKQAPEQQREALRRPFVPAAASTGPTG